MVKSLKVTIPAQAPIDSKPEKEEKKEEEKEEKKEEEKEEEEDGFTTPTRPEFRIPQQLVCPPAPRRDGIHRKTIEKRRKKSAGRRLTSVNVQDLDAVFAGTHT